MKLLSFTVVGSVCLAILLALSPSVAAQNAAQPDSDAKAWAATVDKAIAYLKSSQDTDGGWSTKDNPGVTGIVLTGMLKTRRVTPNDPVAAKALVYIESLVNVEKGHIAGKDPKIQLHNYVTSVNVMALVEAKSDKYKAIIGDAANFLKKLQWDEDEGKGLKDDFYGGAGYDSKSRPDLSNTQFFLDALTAAGIPKDDPAFQKAKIFVSRCQNLKNEYNDHLPWASKIGDGSFIYTAATGGVTKVDDKATAETGLPGYGSMTYAGIKSLIYCGVSKKDQRITKAYEWIQKNYSVDRNPGMPDARAEWGLYYYYHTMAKCLDVMEVEFVVDAKGVKHDWRAELIAAIGKRQQPNGSLVNNKQWMEADPNLATGYALMALSYCMPAEMKSK